MLERRTRRSPFVRLPPIQTRTGHYREEPVLGTQRLGSFKQLLQLVRLIRQLKWPSTVKLMLLLCSLVPSHTNNSPRINSLEVGSFKQHLQLVQFIKQLKRSSTIKLVLLLCSLVPLVLSLVCNKQS